MAKTNHKRGGMRSTRSKKQIKGGMNLNVIFVSILFVLSISDIFARGLVRTPQEQESDLQEIERKHTAFKEAFSKKLGVPVRRITRYSVFIEPESVTKLQEFLREQGLDSQIYVTSEGEVKPMKMSFYRHVITLINIFGLNK